MLRWRILLGTLLIAVLAGLCWLDWRAPWPGAVLLPLALVAAGLATGELLALFRRQGQRPDARSAYTGVLLTVLLSATVLLGPPLRMEIVVGRLGWLAIGLALSLLVAIVGHLRRVPPSGDAIIRLALVVLAILYIGGLLGFMVQLRLIGGTEGGRWGMVAFLSLIATVKMSDMGQYAAGRLVGRHKLAPRISPGKTWEGAAGGVAGAAAGAWLVLHGAAPLMVGAAASASPLRTLLYALLLAASGLGGDLFESLLKRDAGVKDSSTWLPGFGGVLDLLDSLLGAAPVAYLCWVLGLVGPR